MLLIRENKRRTLAALVTALALVAGGIGIGAATLRHNAGASTIAGGRPVAIRAHVLAQSLTREQALAAEYRSAIQHDSRLLDRDQHVLAAARRCVHARHTRQCLMRAGIR